MEHVIAYGSEMAVNATWYLLPKVSPLRQYNTVLLKTKNTSTFSAKMHRIVGGSVDHGLPVREVAARLFALLSDTDRIHNLRSQKHLSLQTLVPVGDRDETFFVTDELRKAALDDKMKEQIQQQNEQKRLKGRSNLKLAKGGFGGGYNAADGSAGNVVGAAHSIEEMLVAARRDLESKKGYRDAADGKTNIPNGFSDVVEGEYNPPNTFGDNNNNNNTNFNANVLKEQCEREEYLTCLEMEIAAKKEEAAKYGFVPQAVDLLDFGQCPSENNMALRYQEQGSPARVVNNKTMVNHNDENDDVMVVPSMNDAPFQSVISGPSYIVSPPNNPNRTPVPEMVSAADNEEDTTNVNHTNAPPSNVTNVHQHVNANYGNDVVPANNIDCAKNVNNHGGNINDNTNPGAMLDLLDFTGDDHPSNQSHYPPHQYQHGQEQPLQHSIQHTNSYPTSPQLSQGRKPAMNHPPSSSDLFPIDLLDPLANVTNQSAVIPSPVVDSEQERRTPSTITDENLSLPVPPPPMDAPPSPPSIQEQELVQEQEQVAIERQLQRQQPSMQVQQQQVQQSMQVQQHVQQMQQQQQQQPPQQQQQPPQQQSKLDPMKQMQNNMSHMQQMMMTNNTNNNVTNHSGINGGNDGGAMKQEQMQANFQQMMEMNQQMMAMMAMQMGGGGGGDGSSNVGGSGGSSGNNMEHTGSNPFGNGSSNINNNELNEF